MMENYDNIPPEEIVESDKDHFNFEDTVPWPNFLYICQIYWPKKVILNQKTNSLSLKEHVRS